MEDGVMMHEPLTSSTQSRNRDEAKRCFMQGVREVLPLLTGIVPFSLIAGIAAINVGIPPGLTVLMSLAVFAGASQLVAYQLIGAGASAWVIVYTAWVVNLRFVVYSASIAPFLVSLRGLLRPLSGYILTDQVYALSMIRFRDPTLTRPTAFYFGASLALWCTWQVGTIVGVVVGSAIPEGWGLDFAMPLSFLSLLAQAVGERSARVAATVAGITAVVGYSLPYNAGLITGILLGVSAGFFFDRWAGSRRGEE